MTEKEQFDKIEAAFDKISLEFRGADIVEISKRFKQLWAESIYEIPVERTTVDELKPSKILINKLKRHGIYTVGALISFPKDRLREIFTFGQLHDIDALLTLLDYPRGTILNPKN